MTYRTIAALPVAATAVAAAALLLVPHDVRPLALRIIAESVKTLALVGLAAGALVYHPGDYMRRGWGLSAVCYACLLVRDASIVVVPEPGAALEVGRALLIVAGNGCMVVGTWTLARAWQVAGLELPGSVAVRRSAIAVAISASLLFAGPSLVVDARTAFSGDLRHAWTIASDLGDLLALPLLAPVAMTALALKDGTLRWPWGLLTTSLGGWLLYDAIVTVPSLLSIEDGGAFRVAGDCARVFAAVAACAAGLAQRRAMRELDAT